MLGTSIVSSYLSKNFPSSFFLNTFVHYIALPVSNHNKMEQIFYLFTIITADT